MRINILGAESLGVRGLCCVVEVGNRKVVIDSGVALGFRRHGLRLHPVQVAASERTKEKIEKVLEDATDVVISHYHGDHIPLVDANPYQLPLERVAKSLKHTRLWLKGIANLPSSQAHRARVLVKRLVSVFTVGPRLATLSLPG